MAHIDVRLLDAPRCPFLGRVDDERTAFTFPHHEHRCFATRRPSGLAAEYQAAYCLAAFTRCDRFGKASRDPRHADRMRAAADAERMRGGLAPGDADPMRVGAVSADADPIGRGLAPDDAHVVRADMGPADADPIRGGVAPGDVAPAGTEPTPGAVAPADAEPLRAGLAPADGLEPGPIPTSRPKPAGAVPDKAAAPRRGGSPRPDADDSQRHSAPAPATAATEDTAPALAAPGIGGMRPEHAAASPIGAVLLGLPAVPAAVPLIGWAAPALAMAGGNGDGDVPPPGSPASHESKAGLSRSGSVTDGPSDGGGDRPAPAETPPPDGGSVAIALEDLDDEPLVSASLPDAGVSGAPGPTFPGSRSPESEMSRSVRALLRVVLLVVAMLAIALALGSLAPAPAGGIPRPTDRPSPSADARTTGPSAPTVFLVRRAA